MKTAEQIADELQQTHPLNQAGREMMVRAIEADRAQRDPNEDGTIHGATIIALQQRLYMAPESEEGRRAVSRAIEWIEEEPDEFWDQFAGPMLDDLEVKFS